MKSGISKVIISCLLLSMLSVTWVVLHVDSFSILSDNKKLSNDHSRKPIRKMIDRDWTYVNDNGSIYHGKGEMKVNIFLPKDGIIKGCVFFMHGFSQFTLAYEKTLTNVSEVANVAIVSVDTGITSWIVLGELISKPLQIVTDVNRAQFVLQRALSEDTKQCIRMVCNGHGIFKDLNIHQNIPIGISGHSMGAGLTLSVAAEFKYVDYVFVMAPVSGVKQFDPVNGIAKRTVDNSMILVGSWDFIAKVSNVEKIVALSNKEKEKSSILVIIHRGVHTGFEDRLVITSIPLERIITFLIGMVSTLEKVFLTATLKLLGSNTAQLEGSELLMGYVFNEMVKDKKISTKNGKKYLEDNLKTRWDKEFNITYV